MLSKRRPAPEGVGVVLVGGDCVLFIPIVEFGPTLLVGAGVDSGALIVVLDALVVVVGVVLVGGDCVLFIPIVEFGPTLLVGAGVDSGALVVVLDALVIGENELTDVAAVPADASCCKLKNRPKMRL